MGGNRSGQSQLTRSLLVGVALGTVALVPVGCTTQDGTGRDGFRPAAGTAAASGTEAELCARALATRNHRDIEALLRAYPNGRCVAPTLAAMPSDTLAMISPAALERVSPATLDRVPAEQADQLRTPDRQETVENRSGSRTAATRESPQNVNGGPY